MPGQIAGLVDGSEVVVEIGQAGRSSLVAGGMAELDVRILGSYFLDIVLVAKAGGEDDITASLNQLTQSGVALSALGNIVLADDLVIAQAQLLLHLLGAQLVVVGVTHVAGVGDVHKAHLDLVLGNGSELCLAGALAAGIIAACSRSRTACHQAGDHGQSHERTQDSSFHL